MKLPFTIALSLFSIYICGQVVPSSIATWKNDADGAYSIIHDDYGDSGVDGIWQYADTIAFNRGLKFTFGAITKSCEASRNINGYSNPYDYAKQVMIEQHNHEIINHSHHHNCALNSGWSPCDFTGWGEVPGSASWIDNLNYSTTSIEANTGHYPRYYIYPYDVFTDEANEELESLGFIGSRTGWSNFGEHAEYHRYGYNLNDEADFYPNTTGFFRTAVQVFGAAEASLSLDDKRDFLNASIDAAINNNEWVNRELHNVGPTGWGAVEVEPYREHLNYVQEKVETGEIWMGTISEVLTYQYQKLKVTPTANYNDAAQEIELEFDFNDATYTTVLADYLDPLDVKTSLTVILDISNHLEDIDFANLKIEQGAEEILDYSTEGDRLLINLYPHKGSVIIKERNTENTKILEQITFDYFPNPANKELYITGGKVWSASIFDTNGSLVLEDNDNRINVDGLAPGVYLIQLNNYQTPQRFVKR